MSNVSHRELQRIFEAAGLLGPGERTAFLDDACGESSPLREEVEALLQADAREAEPIDGGGAEFLALELQQSGSNDVPEPPLPDRIGRYRILRVLSEGGMGVVYEAEQDDPRRRVAVKVVRPTFVTAELLQRFRNEARVLAHLRHPGIAQIFEAGTAESSSGSQPFFAMELVDGLRLTDHADAHDLDFRGRLELVARLCDILHYAHQRGVIHRDLKPANILVASEGSTASSAESSTAAVAGAHPKILDFGVARAQDADLQLLTLATTAGQLIGTVAYMSPEQAEGDPTGIDARTDVYSLGVIAYELLAGRLPLDVRGKLVHEALRIIRDEEPTGLGTIERELRGDVEVIVAKAMAKEREARYSSAAELADDIRRFLAHEPIRARPVSAMVQLRKFARRNKALVGGVLATLVVAVAGAVVAGRFAIEANRSAIESNERAERFERASYISGIAAANAAVEQQDYDTAAAQLNLLPIAHRGWEYEHLRARLVHPLDEWETPAPVVTAPLFDAGGTRMFAVLQDGSLGTWDVESGALLGTRALDGARPGLHREAIALHGPGLRYAVSSAHGEILVGELETGTRTQVIPADSERPPTVELYVHAWDRHGRRLLYGSGNGGEWIWDGERSTEFAAKAHLTVFHPAGDRVVRAGDHYGHVVLRDVSTGELLAETTLDDSFVHLAFSPDGERLALAGFTRNVYLLHGRTLQTQARLSGHRAKVHHVSWNDDGSRLSSTSIDGTLRIWDMERIGSSTVQLVDVIDEQPAVVDDGTLLGPQASFTPDGRHLVVVGHRVRRFPAEDPRVLRGHATYVYRLAFSPDGSKLASACYRDPEVLVWSTRRTEAPWRLSVGSSWWAFGNVPVIGFSKDGRRFVAASNSETLNFDVSTRAALPTSSQPNPVQRFTETLGWRPWGPSGGPPFSPDGRRTAAVHGEIVLIVDANFTQTSSDNPGQFAQQLYAPQFDPDSIAGRLVGHRGAVQCVTYSPDGTRIATGGSDTTVRIWDAHSFEQVLVLHGHDQYVRHVVFSPDGTMLASASGDTTVRLWDTKTLAERHTMGR